MAEACAVPPLSALAQDAAKADFCDSYRVPLTRTDKDMRALYDAVFASAPGWFAPLLALRDVLVRPFGLKSAETLDAPGVSERLGLFPLLAETPDEVVVGAPDRHLTFRIAATRYQEGEGAFLALTTCLVYNRPLGRLYLTLIKPFHKAIVKACLDNAVRAGRI